MVIGFQSNVMAIPERIAELEQSNDARRIEITADVLGAARDRRAILPLLTRLGDPVVQTNSNTEDSVCAALVALGVMRTAGSRYTVLPRHMLEPDVVTMLGELGSSVPLRYFLARN